VNVFLVWDHVFFKEIDLTREESELTSTPEVNRIKRITQLGLVYLAPQFSSAQHTRYDHSLGVLYLANKAGEYLSLATEQMMALRLAALLHDVGHGPFSHFSEKILGWLGMDVKHEETSAHIVRDSPNIGKIWQKYGNLPDRGFIADVISRKPSNDPILDKILSNDIDVDRIDYLLRDLKFTGLGYSLDYERLIQGLAKTNVRTAGRTRIDTAVKEDYVTDANFLLLARVMLRPHVYYEPVHRAAEILIFNCLQQAMVEGGNSEFNLMGKDELKNKLFFKMDDSAMISELEKSSSENYRLINEIKQGKVYDFHICLKWRELSAYLHDEILKKETEPLGFKKLWDFANEIRRDLPTYLNRQIGSNEIFVDIPKLGRLEEASMKVLVSDGKLMRLEDFSPLASSLKEAYKELWSLLVFVRLKNKREIHFKDVEDRIRRYFSEW